MPVFDITCLTGSKEDSCSAQWKWCPSKREFPSVFNSSISGIDFTCENFLNNLTRLLWKIFSIIKKSFYHIRKYKNESKHCNCYILIN